MAIRRLIEIALVGKSKKQSTRGDRWTSATPCRVSRWGICAEQSHSADCPKKRPLWGGGRKVFDAHPERASITRGIVCRSGWPSAVCLVKLKRPRKSSRDMTGIVLAFLLCLDAGCANDLAPFFCLAGDEFAKIGR
jgi:hypothetical protein